MTRCFLFASLLGLSACAAQPPKQAVHLIRAVETGPVEVQAAVAPSAPEPAQVVIGNTEPISGVAPTLTVARESSEPGVLGTITEVPQGSASVEVIIETEGDETSEILQDPVPTDPAPIEIIVEIEDADTAEASALPYINGNQLVVDLDSDQVAEIVAESEDVTAKVEEIRKPPEPQYEQYAERQAPVEEDNTSWLDHVWNRPTIAQEEEELYERKVEDPISETSQIVNNEVVPITQALPPEERAEISEGYSRLGRNYLIEREERDQVSDNPPTVLQKVSAWKQVKNWEIKPGDSLVDLLQDWTYQAGWQLVLETEKDWTFQAGTVLHGNYLEVTSDLFRVMQNAKPSPPKGLAFTKNLVMVLSDDLGRTE